jgi:hypothetical protein
VPPSPALSVSASIRLGFSLGLPLSSFSRLTSASNSSIRSCCSTISRSNACTSGVCSASGISGSLIVGLLIALSLSAFLQIATEFCRGRMRSYLENGGAPAPCGIKVPHSAGAALSLPGFRNAVLKTRGARLYKHVGSNIWGQVIHANTWGQISQCTLLCSMLHVRPDLVVCDPVV